MAEAKNILLSEIERKKRRRRLLLNGLALLGGIGLFTLLGFVGHKQGQTKCWKVEVHVKGGTPGQLFVDSASVTKALLTADPDLIGKEVSQVPITYLHETLLKNPSIREAHVVATVDGRCIVEVEQRTPIARVIPAEGDHFYIDDQGFTMPLSNQSAARVPVFTGAVHEKLQSKSIVELAADSAWAWSSRLDEMYIFTKTIAQNEFWKAMVDHVHFGSDGKMAIIPRVGNHRVVIGSTDNLEMKLKRLMTFYTNTIHERDLNVYSEIHVEYDGQVVGVKR